MQLMMPSAKDCPADPILHILEALLNTTHGLRSVKESRAVYPRPEQFTTTFLFDHRWTKIGDAATIKGVISNIQERLTFQRLKITRWKEEKSASSYYVLITAGSAAGRYCQWKTGEISTITRTSISYGLTPPCQKLQLEENAKI
jgi:hypothetical protein